METGILIAIVGIALVVTASALAPRVGIASPLLLVVLGIGISFLPFVGAVEIEPEWILGGVLPPLLYASAVSIPTMEFRRDLRVISAYSILLVLASSLIIGGVMSWLIPGLGLPLGIALGAIVSPTDAVATSIVRKAGVSSRIVTILEGESLLNDASALVLLRAAIAATGAAVSIWMTGLQFIYALGIAIAIGFGVGTLNLYIRSRITQVTSNVAISLAVPFLAYLPTEHLGGSGLVAAVVAGLVTGHGAPKVLSGETRLTENSVWRTIEMLLESAVFLVMGLQLFGLVEEVGHAHFSIWVAVGFGALAATLVLAVRTVFVAWSVWSLQRREARSAAVRPRLDAVQDKLSSGEPLTFGEARTHDRTDAELGSLRMPSDEPTSEQVAAHKAIRGGAGGAFRKLIWRRRRTKAHARPEPTGRRLEQFSRMVDRRIADIDYLAAERMGWKEGTILVAAGMRGAVTLAAAQSLPQDTPYRALLVLIAFVVAAGTLIIQGSALEPLARKLGVSGQTTDASQWDALQAELGQAAIDRLSAGELVRPNGAEYLPETLEGTRERLIASIQDREEAGPNAADSGEFLDLRLELIGAQKAALLRLRDVGSYPSALLDAALRELDGDQIVIQLRRGHSD